MWALGRGLDFFLKGSKATLILFGILLSAIMIAVFVLGWFSGSEQTLSSINQTQKSPEKVLLSDVHISQLISNGTVPYVNSSNYNTTGLIKYQINGKSMEPTIPDGSIMWGRPFACDGNILGLVGKVIAFNYTTSSVKIGDSPVYISSGHSAHRCVYVLPEGACIEKGDNPILNPFSQVGIVPACNIESEILFIDTQKE